MHAVRAETPSRAGSGSGEDTGRTGPLHPDWRVAGACFFFFRVSLATPGAAAWEQLELPRNLYVNLQNPGAELKFRAAGICCTCTWRGECTPRVPHQYTQAASVPRPDN
jgi:hypothetical protein